MRIAESESDKIYDELIAAHTIMRRGVDLLRAALKHAPTTAGEVDSCVGVGRWLIEFVHSHQRREEEVLWRPLAQASPPDVVELHDLSVQHIAIDRCLDRLAWRLDRLEALGAASARRQAREMADFASAALESAAATISDHLDEEESLLKALLALLDEPVVRTLRAAMARSAPSARPDLVLGLMSDPTPTAGYASMLNSIPFSTRALRPLLIARYHNRKRRLGLAA
jgi:hemerythrin-like domain-containing protein